MSRLHELQEQVCSDGTCTVTVAYVLQIAKLGYVAIQNSGSARTDRSLRCQRALSELIHARA
jgi:hypothetical protein